MCQSACDSLTYIVSLLNQPSHCSQDQSSIIRLQLRTIHTDTAGIETTRVRKADLLRRSAQPFPASPLRGSLSLKRTFSFAILTMFLVLVVKWSVRISWRDICLWKLRKELGVVQWQRREVGRNNLSGNFCLPGPRQESATPYPLAAELGPGKPRRRLRGLKFESQGVEGKENSFQVQIQMFNLWELPSHRFNSMGNVGSSLHAAHHVDSISLVFLLNHRYQPLHCVMRYLLHSFSVKVPPLSNPRNKKLNSDSSEIMNLAHIKLGMMITPRSPMVLQS